MSGLTEGLPPARHVFQVETTWRGVDFILFFLAKVWLCNFFFFMKQGDNLINDDPQSFLAAKVIKCSSSFDHSVNGFKVASFD